MEALHIHGDSFAIVGIKETNCLKYIQAWKSFKEYRDKNSELNSRMPDQGDGE